MAIGTDEKIILEVQLQADEAIKEIQSLKGRIETLKETQKSIDKTTKEGAEAYDAQTAAIKALQSQQRALENQVKNTAASFQFAEGSLSANRAELNALKKQYADLAPELASNLLPKINELTTRIKEQEQGIQVYSRSVGDYENAIRRVLAEQKAQVQTEEQINATLQESNRILNSEESTLREVEVAFRQLKEAQKDASGGIKNDIDKTLLGLETRFLNLSGKQDEFGEKVKKGAAEINDAYADVAGGITAAFQLPEILGFIEKGSAAADVAEKIQTGFAASMQIRQVAIGLAELKTVRLDLAQKAQNVTTAITAALNKTTAATFNLFGASVETTATKFKFLRGAIVASGLGALAIGVIALIQNWDELSAALGGTNEKLSITKKAVQDVGQEFAKERSEVESLTFEFEQQNTSQARKVEIIEELQKISPTYFGTLNKEKATVEELTSAQNKFNDALLKQALLKGYQKQLEELSAAQAQITTELETGTAEATTFQKAVNFLTSGFRAPVGGAEVLNTIDAVKNASKELDDNQKKIKATLELINQTETELQQMGGEAIESEATKKAKAAKEKARQKAIKDAEADRAKLQRIAEQKIKDEENYYNKILSLAQKAREIQISTIGNERERDLASLKEKHVQEQIELSKNYAETKAAAIKAGKETASIEQTYFDAIFNLKRAQAAEITAFNQKNSEEDQNLLFESYKKSLSIIDDGETLQTALIYKAINDEAAIRKAAGDQTFDQEAELERRLLELKEQSLNAKKSLLETQLKDETLNAEQRAEIEKQLAETTIAIETNRLNNSKKLAQDERNTIQATINYRKEIANLSIDIAKATAQLLFSNAQNTRAFALFEVAADTAQALTNTLLNSTSPASADNVATGGLASIPKYLTIAATIITNAAKVKQILEGEPPQPVISVASFSSGGYTGRGGRYEPAGIVHRDEYVVPSPVLNSSEGRSLVGRLESLRSNVSRTGISGFADGGFTSSAAFSAAANNFQTAKIFSATFEKAASKIRPVVSVKEINSVQTRVSVTESRSRL